MNAERLSGPRPAPGLEGTQAYGIPRVPGYVSLFLDGNEGAVPPRELLDSLSFLGSDLMRRYPDARPLEEQLAAELGLDPSRVLVTAGGDDALDRACRAYLAPGRELILPEPSFEMIPRYARLTGAGILSVPWPGGDFPVEQVIAKLSPRTAAIAVVSPNNPTGAVACPDDLERLSAAAPNALLIVDLAYAEFAEDDLMECSLRLPNALAVRSLSKAWGLAGLRVGYAAGPSEIIACLRATGHPYAVARPSLELAGRRVREGREQVSAFVQRIRMERSGLFELLERLGADPEPSQANFVLAGFGDAAFVHRALAALGIAVRIFPGREELAGKLRITCPGEERGYSRITHALETIFEPQALLFDMDGVLVDVSGSYRRAIIDTAASFGVRADLADVARAKTQAGSNNDWELTRRLLEQKGVAASLEEVTVRFEALYQGTKDSPGLWTEDKLMPGKDTLEQLSRRLPLGIVTGRPRGDAVRFLEHTGIGSLFKTLVCMEDAPLKPDPAAVRLALEKIGIQRAWMLGDTPDDIEAARRAGVLPIGVARDGEEAPLLDAGAARVLTDIYRLKELLP